MTKKIKVRDRRNKEWFYLDNEYLNGFGKEMGAIGIAVYVSLCRHANNETQKCFPSQKKIAEEIGSSERTVRRYLDQLEKANIIKIVKERSGKGKWLNNTYYLLDKSEWIYPKVRESDGKPEDRENKPRGQRTQSHRTESPINNTNKNNTNKNNTNKLETKVSGLNDLIDLFKSVNPSYERLFSNTTQRSALERLVKKFGEQKLIKLIKILPGTNKRKYAPTITTPYELEKKLGKLKAFLEKENSNNNKVASFKTK